MGGISPVRFATMLGSLAVVVSCARASKDLDASPPAPPEQTPAPAKEPVVERDPRAFVEAKWWDGLFQAFNDGRFEEASERFSATVTARTIGMSSPDDPSRQNLVLGWQQARAMLPDNRMMAERVLIDGDVAFAQVVTTGTHSGDIEGFPATGAPVGWYSLFQMHFDDEAVVDDLTIYTNPLVFAAQVGAVRRRGDTPVPSLPTDETVAVVEGAGDADNGAVVESLFAAMGEGWSSVAKVLPDAFAQGVVVHETYSGEVHEGRPWLTDYLRTELEVADRHAQSGLHVHAIGDFVVVTGTWSAHRTRRMPGVGGKGRDYRYDFADVYRFSERTITEVWWYRNPDQIITQLSE